ncbi:hypothetical protein AB0N14_20200 [Streptomyces sp. NPDC051104]|uniref:hypothetical protein n=1 Tax=Streptomyces sp. NPDC051104 TaxID=3155044 RepID=UPI00343E5F46
MLKVVRTDRLGTGTLSSVTVAADGTFTIDDVPRARREVTYTVSWPGDDLHDRSGQRQGRRATRLAGHRKACRPIRGQRGEVTGAVVMDGIFKRGRER